MAASAVIHDLPACTRLCRLDLIQIAFASLILFILVAVHMPCSTGGSGLCMC